MPPLKLRLETNCSEGLHAGLRPCFQLPAPLLTSAPLLAVSIPVGGEELSWPSALIPHLHMRDFTLEAH